MDPTRASPEPSGAPDPAPPDALPGASLQGERGRYAVERLLAEGGMARVYAARAETGGGPVVVKRPHVELLSRPGARERFRREIGRLGQLEHPHVVRVLDHGEHGGLPFYVLPFLEGGSLADRLAGRPGGRMPAAESLTWLPVVAATLDHVHARGVVHRDVKPGNILFDGVGGAVLSDFGIARALGTDETPLTSTGVGVGSPEHMAPEQALGSGVGPAADQYGLASTLFAALAGRPPFVSDTPLGLLVRKQIDTAPTVAAALPDLPPAAAAVLVRGLARDPAARYPSCSAFAAAFAGALAGVALASPAAPRRRWPRRALAVVALAGAALGLLLLRPGGAGTVPGPSLPPLPPPPPFVPAPPQALEAERLGVPASFDNALGMRLVLVPAGTFLMGSPATEADRKPDEVRHSVTLTRAYYLQSTEVTNAQFRRFRPGHRSGRLGAHSLDGDDQPATGLSWFDAQAFVDWLNREDPLHRYRLPTEAEWERAARAGTDGRWWWGDDVERLPRHANFGDAQARAQAGFTSAVKTLDDGFVLSAPVARLDPNPWGLYDVLGNVWECTADWRAPYDATPVLDPRGPENGPGRVYRGGAYRHGPDLVRAAYRFSGDPFFPLDDLGIRVAADAPGPR